MAFMLEASMKEEGKCCKICKGDLEVWDYELIHKNNQYIFVIEAECYSCDKMYIVKLYA